MTYMAYQMRGIATIQVNRNVDIILVAVKTASRDVFGSYLPETVIILMELVIYLQLLKILIVISIILHRSLLETLPVEAVVYQLH